jgi:dsRNA-specific ribonuclease
MEYKKKHKELNGITTSQGRPIFSAVNIYRHYLTQHEWHRASQLPALFAFFERSMYCSQMAASLGCMIHPEFILWCTSAKGVHTTKKCYETLETYGDTILKLAATHLAYDKLEADPKADESKITDLKTGFITNLWLFKIGKKLELRNYMRTKDPEIKEWRPPYTSGSKIVELLTCTGKNIADGVESLLGALFLSSNLYRTLK